MRTDAEMEEGERVRVDGNRKMPDQVLCAVELQGPMLAIETAIQLSYLLDQPSAAGEQERRADGSSESQQDTGRRSRGRVIS